MHPSQTDSEALEAGRLAIVGRLARGIGHEINNSLFVLLALVELLLRDVEPDSKAHGRLTQIQASGGEIRDVVRGMLELARRDAPGAETCDLAVLVEEAAEIARKGTLGKDVEVVTSVPPATPPVEGSPRDLRLLLVSLLTEAHVSLPRGGQVRLEASAADGSVTLHVGADGERGEEGAPPLVVEAWRLIVEGHGGRVERGAGAVTVTLPASKSL
jgi:signal transduction histidine kinase